MAGLNSFLDHSLIICLITLLVSTSLNVAFCNPLERTSSAFFIFGDSSVDPGNNNYIDTIPENRADYEPYGQNGFFPKPTGRFSDGRVIVDFIVEKNISKGVDDDTAEYARLPIIPPFLQPSVDYTKGVNFASGGAGVLSETNQGLAIDFQRQLKSFEEVQKSLAEKLGDEEAQKLISEAVYLFGIGSNDYMGGYLGNLKMQQRFNPEQYVGMVIGNLTHAIQTVYQNGGRKFGFLSLPPLGCLPILRALNPRANHVGGCFKEASALALAHNNALNAVLKSLEYTLKDFKYCTSNLYDWLHDIINNPTNYGFKDGVSACCGSGPYGGIFSCGGRKNITDYQLCDTPLDFVWWDSLHPTERIHHLFASLLWSGSTPSVGPYNLQGLFFDKEENIATTIGDVVDRQNPELQSGVF